jgi:hypothetical protein
MSAIVTKIIFPAVLEDGGFVTQVVKLGGIFPIIEIEVIDLKSGLHYFKIEKSMPHLEPNMIASVVAESELQIDLFWNILAYIRDIIIRSTGQIMYETNGEIREFNPIHPPSTCRMTHAVGNKWFEDKADLFKKEYDLDLLKRFNYSRAINEPIGRFVSLYSLLLSLENDKQEMVDERIEKEEPNVGKSLSPRTNKPETIFTRLRNELAHDRRGCSITKTHKEIDLHLPRFEWIAKKIVRRKILEQQ